MHFTGIRIKIRIEMGFKYMLEKSEAETLEDWNIGVGGILPDQMVRMEITYFHYHSRA